MSFQFREWDTCARCGKEVRRLRCTDGHTYRVDPESVWIRRETGGETFLYIIEGHRAEFRFGHIIGDAWEGNAETAEVYIPHEGTCSRKHR